MRKIVKERRKTMRIKTKKKKKKRVMTRSSLLKNFSQPQVQYTTPASPALSQPILPSQLPSTSIKLPSYYVSSSNNTKAIPVLSLERSSTPSCILSSDNASSP